MASPTSPCSRPAGSAAAATPGATRPSCARTTFARKARACTKARCSIERAGERGPFVWAGHSFGGLLAANVARRRPDLVHTLVLLDPTPLETIVFGPRLGALKAMRRTAWLGGFAQDMLMAQRSDAAGAVFRRLVHESPMAEAAARLMGSRQVRFFYDQMFVKEPGSVAPTPWHQDLPYWPLRGDQICGLWCPLDPVDLDSGAVEYVRGSHLSGRWYRPQHFGGDAGYEGARGETMPDIEATIGPADRLSWALQPGDAIAFHGLVIHGAGGNRSALRRRRAGSLRWMGDDAVFDDRPGTYPFDLAGQIPGTPLRGDLYPQVWPRRV